MAQLKDGINFTGRLGDFTAYRMKGCKNIILRRRGGVSARRMKSDPNFKTVWLNAKEFGARSKAMSVFVKMLKPHKTLGDYNYSNAISARMKLVQDLDTESVLGRRSILFSKHPEFWEGFSLNESRSFDLLIFAPLVCTISRDTMSARVEIPELIPNINTSVSSTLPLFRIQTALGLLPDFVFQDVKRGHVPSVAKDRIAPVLATTPWQPCLSTTPATTLEMKLPPIEINGGFALMVSIGICFGMPMNGGRVLQIDDKGAAKVLAVR
jgi:hypothetical protein